MKVLLTAAVAASCLFAVAAATPGPAAFRAARRRVRRPDVAGSAGLFLLSRDRRTIKRLDIEWYAEADQCTSAITYMSGTTFRVTAVVTDAARAVINRCETGTLTWRAVQ